MLVWFLIQLGSAQDVCATCPYTTIGQALAEGSSDLILIGHGTYAENLVVERSVRL